MILLYLKYFNQTGGMAKHSALRMNENLPLANVLPTPNFLRPHITVRNLKELFGSRAPMQSSSPLLRGHLIGEPTL
jgi:hypothetical protein